MEAVQLDPRLEIPEEDGLTEPSIRTLAATLAAGGGADATTAAGGIRLGEEELEELLVLVVEMEKDRPLAVAGAAAAVGLFVKHMFNGEGGESEI